MCFKRARAHTKVSRKWPNVDQIRAQSWSNPARNWPKLLDVCQTAVEIGLKSAKSGKILQSRPTLGRTRATLCRNRLKVGPISTEFGSCQPKLDGVRPISSYLGRVGPIGQFGPEVGRIVATFDCGFDVRFRQILRHLWRPNEIYPGMLNEQCSVGRASTPRPPRMRACALCRAEPTATDRSAAEAALAASPRPPRRHGLRTVGVAPKLAERPGALGRRARRRIPRSRDAGANEPSDRRGARLAAARADARAFLRRVP